MFAAFCTLGMYVIAHGEIVCTGRIYKLSLGKNPLGIIAPIERTKQEKRVINDLTSPCMYVYKKKMRVMDI